MRSLPEIEADAARCERVFDWLHSWCRAATSAFGWALWAYAGLGLVEAVQRGSPRVTSALVAFAVLAWWWLFWWLPIEICRALTRRMRRLHAEAQEAAKQRMG